jgi:L-amino acid N-acyltransferase YncA
VRAEFAIVVRSDVKARGVGHVLLSKLIAYCTSRGTKQLVGEALPDNHPMITLARTLGFDVVPLDGSRVVSLRLTLRGAAATD